MPANADEVARRTQAALVAIGNSHGTEDAEFSTTLFVSHHLEELDASYWQAQLGTERPEPAQILALLELRSHWSDDEDAEDDKEDDGIDVFDFTLPGDVTQYVLSVQFDEDGAVEGISMES